MFVQSLQYFEFLKGRTFIANCYISYPQTQVSLSKIRIDADGVFASLTRLLIVAKKRVGHPYTVMAVRRAGLYAYGLLVGLNGIVVAADYLIDYP